MSTADVPVLQPGPEPIDVTDATFQAEVVDRSTQTPVVVDLWAPWCGPCRTLGPILERVIGATQGQVVLAKVNVDENPQVSASFRVQGIPAVYAVAGGKVVDGFVGAQGEAAVVEFVNNLLPTEEQNEVARLISAGDEGSLRAALELEPGHHDATVMLAELLVEKGDPQEALRVLETIPETTDVRRVAALARTGEDGIGDVDARLTALLDRVRDDEAAKQEFLDVLELLGPSDPRTAGYRKALTSRLF
ncbi:MAG: tetratricopeptide repeat protein [Acidimicrobiia bacterium]|nr:tetratricopeptide repeat protein [Acidimicrobiia bacterium]